MADTITESFCERCGTRYEFKAPTRLNPLRKTRGLIGGLKNYVMSQDDLGDALGDAMRSEEGRLASAQLEAFHESFNFCIDCRQYTCLNCWNDTAGRCRSCHPIAGTDDLAERLTASLAGTVDAIAAPPVGFDGTPAGVESWPTSDLPEPEPAAATNGHVPVVWPVADGFVYETERRTDETVRADDGFVYDHPLPAAAFVPEEIEPTWEPATADLEVEAEPVVAEETAVEAIAEPEPEPVVWETFTEPEAEPAAWESVAEPEPEPVAWESAIAPEPEAVVWEIEPKPVAAEEVQEPVAAEEPEPIVLEEVEPQRPSLRVVAWDEDAAYDLEPEPITAEELELEPVVAEELEPEPVAVESLEAEPVMAEELEVEPVIAETFEAEPAMAEELEAEPIMAEELEPEPVAAEESEREPVAAEEIEPEPEPEPFAHRMGPIGDTILRFPQRPAQAPTDGLPAAAELDTPEVAARRAQLDLLGLGDPGEGPVQQTRPGVLPYRSRGSGVTQGELASRAAAHGATFWEASAREVAGAAAHVGVQNCGQCGLSLSANARFCRRCGTRQAQSA